MPARQLLKPGEVGRPHWCRLLLILAAGCAVVTCATVTVQEGGAYDDVALSPLRVDGSGHFWVAGYTGNSLYGTRQANYPDTDYFLAKFDGTTGARLVSVQNGTTWQDRAVDLVLTTGTTSPEPYVYVVGITDDEFIYNTNHGSKDYFIAKHDSTGAWYWTNVYGSDRDDLAYAVDIDTTTNDMYIVGTTRGNASACTSGTGGAICVNSGDFDLFLEKVNSAGTVQWSRMIGSNQTEWAGGVALSGSDVFVAGYTGGYLNDLHNSGSSDLFIAKYTTAGSYTTLKFWGTSTTDTLASIAVHSGALYAVGKTYDYTARADDYKLYQLSTSDLTVNWEKATGTEANDYAGNMYFDGSDVYVIGTTAGEFGSYIGQTGKTDFFVAKHSTSDGSVTWTKQGGTYWRDTGNSGVLKSDGSFWVCGATKGDFSDSNVDHTYSWDYFITNNLAKPTTNFWDDYEEYWIIGIIVVGFFGTLCLVALLCCPFLTCGYCARCCYERCNKNKRGYGLID